MKITNVEKKENSTVELTIQVEGEVFQNAVKKAYEKMKHRVNVPGFRKGKAPRKIIEKMYGSSIFYDDAIKICYPSAYADAVKEQGLEEVGYPRIEVLDVDENGFSFKGIVSVKPEVTVTKYKGLTAPKVLVPVTDVDIENELKPLVSRASRIVSVERAVKDGDTAVIDFEGFDQGVPFQGGKGSDYSLVIGSGSFVPGFEDQVIGMKTGEEKEINIKFPDEYAPELAGKDVVFKVKVNDVKESQAPDLDDEFAKDVSEFDTLAELKEDLSKKLADRRKEKSEQDFENAILNQLVENMEGAVPETMVALQIDKLLEDLERRLQSQGMNLKDYTKMMGGNEANIRQSMAPTALHQVKSQLALGAVADAENFEITDDELLEEVKQLALDYGISEEQVKASVPEPTLRSDMRLKHAAEFVINEAKEGELPVEKSEEAAEEAPKKKTTKKAATKSEEVAEEGAEEKKAAPKKRATKKKTEDAVEGEVAAEKPKRTRKKKTDETEA